MSCNEQKENVVVAAVAVKRKGNDLNNKGGRALVISQFEEVGAQRMRRRRRRK